MHGGKTTRCKHPGGCQKNAKKAASVKDTVGVVGVSTKDVLNPHRAPPTFASIMEVAEAALRELAQQEPCANGDGVVQFKLTAS